MLSSIDLPILPKKFSIIPASNKFCPYEIAGKKAFKTDIVICDFNYLFASGIMENFLGRIGRSIEESILVVDEAHNLPSRIRNSYSYVLSTELIKNALKELNDNIQSRKFDKYFYHLKSALEDLYFELLLGEKTETLLETDIFLDRFFSKFDDAIKPKLIDIIEELWEVEALVKENKVISYVGRAANFLNRLRTLDKDNYLEILEKYIQKDKTTISLKIKCIDPSDIAGNILNNSYSSILMSATLSPITMYKDILGIENASLLELESPFDSQNQLTIVDDEVTSKFTMRDENMYKKIANRIKSYLDSSHNKNAIVFFPSYDFLDRVTKNLSLGNLNRKVFIEQKFMTKDQKEDFVNKFKDNAVNIKSKVLFGITGGSFAEGLDLPKSALEIVIVVGLPLTVPDVTTENVIRHYDKKFKKGQLYGYIFPAMNRIIQAAGRCIRTEEDRGVIVLMDFRYLWPLYAQIFPKNWRLKCIQKVDDEIKGFFSL
jgi:DNA excision repair protein ERCC-2